MARYYVVFSEEFGVEMDFGPLAPTPRDLVFAFEAHTDEQLRDLVMRLGFNPTTMDVTKDLHVRYGVPVSCDGEKVARACVQLWLGEELSGEKREPKPVPAMERLKATVAGS